MVSHLKKYLLAHGVSAYRLSKDTGLALNTVYGLMDRDKGTIGTWQLIADALGCTIDEILNFGGDYDGGELCGEGSEADKRDN